MYRIVFHCMLEYSRVTRLSNPVVVCMKLITKNKKAFFDYEIIDTLEAGIVLSGDEVKSLRAGKVNMTGAFATFHNGELHVTNLHITPYD